MVFYNRPKFGALQMKIPILHDIGYSPCFNIAFYYVGEPIGTNTILNAHNIELLDGTKPESNDTLRCDNCKEIFYLPWDLRRYL